MAVYNGGKNKTIIASGQIGENPTIHIWDAQTRKTLSVLSGKHKRGDYCVHKRLLLYVSFCRCIVANRTEYCCVSIAHQVGIFT